MSFIQFHLGPALFIGLLLFPILDLLTFIIANVIVHTEPFLIKDHIQVVMNVFKTGLMQKQYNAIK